MVGVENLVGGNIAMGDVALDRRSPIPLYFQVAEEIKRLVHAGLLSPGQLLIGEIEMARQLKISRQTVRQAIDRCVDEGILVRRRGVGTVVLPSLVDRHAEFASLYDDLEAAGRCPRTDVLLLEEREAGQEWAEELDIEPGDRVLYLKRVRYADDAPLTVMRNVVPVGVATITREALEEKGLYELLREQGVQPKVVRQRIGARQATREEAIALGVARGITVLTLTCVAFDATGRAIDFGNHTYRADRYAFRIAVVSK